MTRLSLKLMAVFLVALTVACATPPPPAPPPPPPPPMAEPPPPPPRVSLRVMQGFLLAANQAPPTKAAAYAIPVFSSVSQAEALCLGFDDFFTFEEQFTASTPIIRQEMGEWVAVVPFLWPVRSGVGYSSSPQRRCSDMARNYNMAAARVARQKAAGALVRYGAIKSAADIANAPLVVVFDEQADRIIVYDYSEIPVIDYRREIADMKSDIESMRAAAGGSPAYFKADLRQRVRFYAFQGEPALRELVYALAPGLKQG